MCSINIPYNLIIILGPTATGKTEFASHIAAKIDGEIISADSRQVYRDMDLGTGKDYKDYIVGNKNIPYHLIDIQDPGYKYNVFEYQKDFIEAFNKISAKGKKAILCGGTGLYIEAVSKGYKLIAVPRNEKLRATLKDKSLQELEEILNSYRKLHNKTDTDTLKRATRAIEIEEYYRQHPEVDLNYPTLNPVYLGVKCDREIRRARITKRLHARLKEGMVDEVRELLDNGASPEDLIYYGLEYKFITLYLLGEMDYDTMASKLNTAIHQFAKRQMTWFRKMEREGTTIHWIDSEQGMDQKVELALSVISV